MTKIQENLLKLYELNSLEEATIENWPWMEVGREKEWIPYFPNLKLNNEVALVVAEKLASKSSLEFSITPQGYYIIGWTGLTSFPGEVWGDYGGESLGSAIEDVLGSEQSWK